MTDIQILDTYGYTMCPARSECPTSHHEKLGPYRVRSDVVAPHRFSDEFIVGHHEHSSTLGFTERNRRRRRCGRNGCPEPDGNAEAPARGHIGISAAFPKNRTRELSRAGSLGVPNHIHREWRPAVKRFVGGNSKFPIRGNRKPHTLVVGGLCPAFHDVGESHSEGAGGKCTDGRRGCC